MPAAQYEQVERALQEVRAAQERNSPIGRLRQRTHSMAQSSCSRPLDFPHEREPLQVRTAHRARRLRVSLDAFNVLNQPGMNLPDSGRLASLRQPQLIYGHFETL